jgi:hypothetical protein
MPAIKSELMGELGNGEAGCPVPGPSDEVGAGWVFVIIDAGLFVVAGVVEETGGVIWVEVSVEIWLFVLVDGKSVPLLEGTGTCVPGGRTVGFCVDDVGGALVPGRSLPPPPLSPGGKVVGCPVGGPVTVVVTVTVVVARGAAVTVTNTVWKIVLVNVVVIGILTVVVTSTVLVDVIVIETIAVLSFWRFTWTPKCARCVSNGSYAAAGCKVTVGWERTGLAGDDGSPSKAVSGAESADRLALRRAAVTVTTTVAVLSSGFAKVIVSAMVEITTAVCVPAAAVTVRTMVVVANTVEVALFCILNHEDVRTIEDPKTMVIKSAFNQTLTVTRHTQIPDKLHHW